MLFLPQIKLQLPAFMFVNTIDLHNELRNEYLGLGKDSVRSSINYEAYSTGLKKKKGWQGGGGGVWSGNRPDDWLDKSISVISFWNITDNESHCIK